MTDAGRTRLLERAQIIASTMNVEILTRVPDDVRDEMRFYVNRKLREFAEEAADLLAGSGGGRQDVPMRAYADAAARFHVQMVVESNAAHQDEHVRSMARLSALWRDVQDASKALAGSAPGDAPKETRLDLVQHLHRQREFSERTFGPGPRTMGALDHIRKELREIEAKPADLSEWIDVVLLALDGAWRSGHSPEEIAAALTAKQTRNEARRWPDWRTADPNRAIEHDRGSAPGDAPQQEEQNDEPVTRVDGL